MHDGVMITEKAAMRALHVAYAENIGSIVSSDFMFAIMDYDDIEFSGELYGKTDKPKERIFHGFDSGTAFEIGMAVAYGKPVVAYIPSGVKLNLMLSLATKGYTTDITKVKDLVQE